MSTANKTWRVTQEQKDRMMVLFIAGYTVNYVNQKLSEEFPGFVPLTAQAINKYKSQWREEIELARQVRQTDNLNQGLALRAERIARLVEHAETLEAVRYLQDDKGRLVNEKAWRATLDDIAKEVGDRRPDIDARVGIILDCLRDTLTTEQYAQVLARLAFSSSGASTTGS